MIPFFIILSLLLPVLSVTANQAPICLFGSYCLSNSDCISGTSCFKHTDGSSQCLLEMNPDSLHTDCSAPFQSCSTTSVCCNKAFFCSPGNQVCLPVYPPKCRNPDSIPSDPAEQTVSVNAVDQGTNHLPPLSPWVMNYDRNLAAVVTPPETNKPTNKPTTKASTTKSTVKSSLRPSARPSAKPSNKNTIRPTSKPSFTAKPSTRAPTAKPSYTAKPSTRNPTAKPSYTAKPNSRIPTLRPSVQPTSSPIKPILPPPGSGYFTSKGNQIVDSYGNPVRITGINWCGYDSDMYTLIGLNMRSYRDIINDMQKTGFNAFRIPFCNQMLQIKNDTFGIQYINYYLNPDLQYLNPLETLDRILEYCRLVNMRVILDRHSVLPNHYPSELYWYIPKKYPEERVIADLQFLAKRYINNPAMIGIDLWNEPKTNTVFAEWSAAATRLGNAVLEINPYLLILVEGTGYMYWWGGCLKFVTQYPVKLINPNQVIYSPHDYGPSVVNQTWFNVKGYPANMPEKFTSNWGFVWRSTSDPRPLIIGEFGAPLIYPKEGQWMSSLLRYMNGDFNMDGNIQIPKGSQGMSWMYWSVAPIGDAGGIYEEDFVTINQLKLSYIKSSFSKTPFISTSPQPTAVPTSSPIKLDYSATFSFVGCYADNDITKRILPSYGVTLSDIKDCAAYAKGNGFTLFGTQWYNGPGPNMFQCWVGNTNPVATLFSWTGCALGNDNTYIYGKGGFDAVFAVNYGTLPSTSDSFSYIGCFGDSQSLRALPMGGVTVRNIQDCAGYAKYNGYQYFGTQWYNGPGTDQFQCWVGTNNNQATQYGISSLCVLGSDNTYYYGGGGANAVFMVNGPTMAPAVVPSLSPAKMVYTGNFYFTGCYIDFDLAQKILSDYGTAMSNIQDCAALARGNGYSLFGTQWYNGPGAGMFLCWLGNTYPASSLSTLSGCTLGSDNKYIYGGSGYDAVFAVNNIPVATTFTYIGCYGDLISSRAIAASTSHYLSNINDCASYAKANGYQYFGTQWYNGPGLGQFECWVGNDLVLATQYGASTSCSIGSDNTYYYGAGGANALFKTTN